MKSDIASDRLAPLSTYDFTSLVEKVAYLLPVSGRMEAIANEQKRQVIVDYAHTPDALKNVLAAIKEYAPANVVCVFGCGGDRDKEKRAVMASIAETYADQVFVTSDNPRHENPSVIIDDICKGFSKKNHRVIEDRQQAISVAIESSAIHDVILIAGKGHEDYQIVGDTKLSFSDQHVARIALRHIASKSTGAIS